MMMKTITFITLLMVAMVNISVAGANRDWTGIVVHHSESGQKTTVADINQWHLENGWSGIGYNFVIEWDGSIKKGRPLSKVGAHAKSGKSYSRNSTHIGICLVGRDTFTKAQLKSLKGLVRNLNAMFDIKSVERHHEECPGAGVDVDSLDKSIR
jgi:N-acetylmuramoyl-L-alanine amidase